MVPAVLQVIFLKILKLLRILDLHLNRDVEDLREKLGYLIDNPEKVRQKKKIAREHVLNNYSWDTITDQMEELYLEVLNK